MKIKKDILLNHINKVTLGGKIPDLNLKFDDNGISTKIISPSNICLVERTLSKTKFVEYEKLTELFIPDSLKFMEFLKTFKDEIEMNVNLNVLRLKEGAREIFVILGNPEALSSLYKQDVPTFNVTIKTEINTEVLKIAVKDLTLLKETGVIIRTKNGKLSFEIGDDNFDKTFNSINIDSNEEIYVKIGSFLVDYVKVCGEKVTVNLNTDSPIMFEETEDGSKTTTIIAPMVKSD